MSFLVSSKHECCCPEMRCCTPETVTATVAGMAGQTLRGPSFFVGGFGPPNPLPPGWECYVCPGDGFMHSLMDAMARENHATGLMGNMSFLQQYYQDWYCYYGEQYKAWPPAAFPPAVALVRVPDCEPFDMYGDPVNCEEDITSLTFWDVYSRGGVASLDIARWIINTAKCDIEQGGHPKFCERPDNDGLHVGPCTGGPIYHIHNENDLNGTYICHRPTGYLRPQLKYRIHRQVPLAEDSPYRGATEAQLLYNVDPRRTWTLLGPPWDCWDIGFPPEGEAYCVDYRCGKRVPWYAFNGGEICSRGKCTVTAQGLVKPHLYYYHQSLNQTATLYLRLVPQDYERDVDGRFPTWWRASEIDVVDGGYGYSVGEYLQLDFDIRRRWLGGEIMTVFSNFDMTCLPYAVPRWRDEDGYEGVDITMPNGLRAQKMFQRAKITEVGENGEIRKLRVLPIYKYNEYKDPPLCMVAKVGDERTKFYVGYARLLCHPRSVQLPGVGYTVGDQIEFYCDDPPCTVEQPTIAVVSDVDEEGGILDWRVRGSDFPFGYATIPSCNETNELGQCIQPCGRLYYDMAAGSEPDERGTYNWKGKSLCELRWVGVGVPARAVRISLFDSPFGTPCLEGHKLWSKNRNDSGYTTIDLKIARVACETSIEATVGTYPFGRLIENSSDKAVRLLYLFPPFPPCHGGGAVVEPLFGAWGGNESEFGGPLAGGIVRAGGGGFCFRDKIHVEPTLPLDIPAIGSGFGAKMLSYDFRAVHNFPNPDAGYGDSRPAYNRFSYFPVEGAVIDPEHRGTGYSVGQTFEVAPAGGREVSDVWLESGADNPDVCPNGAWWGGERSNAINASGYWSVLFDPVAGEYGEPVHAEPSKCTLRIASVDENGGILSLEVIYGGMMFKTVRGSGRLNPTVFVTVQSTLGYGAYIQSTFETNYESDRFGELVGVVVVDPPPGVLDPKHTAVAASPGMPAVQAQPIPRGGRDYADQSAGYFWMLRDTAVGGPVCPTWGLLAHLPWGRRNLFGQSELAEFPSPHNWFHSERSTHYVTVGSLPPYVPASTVCAFSDCYHDLLTRTYPLYKLWGGECRQGTSADGPGAPVSPDKPAAWPKTAFAQLLRKGKIYTTDVDDPSIAKGGDHYVLEYGPTVSLSYTPSSPCPDHSNGTTTRE